MEQLMQDGTKDLLNFKDEICLSFFLSSKSKEAAKRDFIRLSNEAYAIAEGAYSLRQVSEVLSRVSMDDLLVQVDPRYDTLCLFVSTHETYFVQLDLTVKPHVVVDRSFFIRPLASTIAGSDQGWLLEVTKQNLTLSIVSLSGVAVFIRTARSERPGLKYIIRTINHDRRPWFLAGEPSQISQIRPLLSNQGLKKAPSAHILHSNRELIEESVREVIRIRTRLARESSEQKLLQILKSDEQVLTDCDVIARAVEKKNIETLYVEEGLREPFPGYLSILNEDDLRIDDIVERALTHQTKVIPIRDLEKTLGTRLAAVQKGAA